MSEENIEIFAFTESHRGYDRGEHRALPFTTKDYDRREHNRVSDYIRGKQRYPPFY